MDTTISEAVLNTRGIFKLKGFIEVARNILHCGVVPCTMAFPYYIALPGAA